MPTQKCFVDIPFEEENFLYNGNYYGVRLYGLTFNYTEGSRGYRNSMGVPEEPDEQAEIEFIGYDSSIVDYSNDRGDLSEVSEESGVYDEVLKSFIENHMEGIEKAILCELEKF